MTTTRTCPNCGAQVGENQRFCANCGSRMPEQPEKPAIEPTIALPALTPPPTTPPQGQTPLPPPLPPQGTPPQGQAPFGLPADAPTAAQPAPRRGLPVWAIVLLSLAGLCIVGCVASFALLGYFGQQVSAVFSTAVVDLDTPVPEPSEEGGELIVPSLEAIPTRPAEAPTENLSEPTAAPTVSGGGGIVGGGVGGGASAVQTAEAQTAEALQATEALLQATAEIEQIYGASRVVFNDEFVDNRNNWFTGVFQEIETDVIEDGVFKVIWQGASSSYELYEVRELTNFIAEVDCLVAAGGTDGSCALVFAQRTDVGFYKFELFEDYYRLFVVRVEGDPPILVEGNPEEIVRPGDWNRLRVIKQGERIRIYINDIQVGDVNDATYLTGKIGVSTNSYNEAGGVEIWFDNFAVRELP